MLFSPMERRGKSLRKNQKEKGLRIWAVTPLFDMVAGPGFEPGTFAL